MALYIKDPGVDDLAEQLRVTLKATTKTDAVRQALRNELARQKEAMPMPDRLHVLQDLAAEWLPASVEGVDMKDLMDKLWEEGA